MKQRQAIKPKNLVPCKCGCGEKVRLYRTTDKRYFNSECEKRHKGEAAATISKQRKPIAKVSEKRKGQNAEYWIKRKAFLALPENQICFINGCEAKANTIEHRRGRIGTNYLDETTWAPCCLKHNLELENNPELSKQYQLSKIHNGSK